FFNFKAIAAALAALVSVNKIGAKPNNANVVYESASERFNRAADTVSTPVSLNKDLDIDSSLVMLKGKVINAKTKQPVPYADIYIDNTDYKTTVDSAGNFTITVPRYFLKEKMLTAEARWYKTKIVPLNRINPQKPIKVEFDNREEMILGRW
ncbi:MAG: hypothetical protein JWO06_933, partial [Bacteroidota bacterium]|nr:hypothetical protein [Bacteroidota bacterium]